jgi:hypothetical protein
MKAGDTINVHKFDNGYRVSLDPKWIETCGSEPSTEPAREWDLIYKEDEIGAILQSIGDELARSD